MAYTDRELLARTLQAEAGNQGRSGMLAAGSVIMNRAQTSGYGDGVRGVIMKPGQFSAWNSVTGYAGGEQGQDMAAMTPSGDAYSAADALIGGQYSDPTGGATHYYNPSISQPSWGIGNGGDWARIGDHVFGNADAGRGNTPARASTRNAQPPNTRNAPTGGILSNEGNQMAQPQQPQRPQGLLGSLGIQRRDPNAQGETSQPFYNRQSFGDTLARLAPALGRMGVMGLEGPMQAQLDTRNQRQGDERAQTMLDTQRNQTREWIASQPNGDQYAAMFDAVGGEATLKAMQVDATGDATTVQSSVPLDDGTTVMIMRDGSRRVLSPTGEELMGQAAADAIRAAREYTVENQTAISEGRRRGTNIGETDTGESAAAAGARGAAIGSQDAADEIKLREMQRNLPGLMGVVDRLDALSGAATFSRVEVAADSARRALGQEVSAGGIARAEYIATVDNEILPLLRQTFGAAFTVEEGARLRATLGNEDGTPAERRATLNAFIQQKQAELESFGGSMPAPAPPAGGSIDVDPALLEFMTPEERALFQ
jgi:hypothetical protein